MFDVIAVNMRTGIVRIIEKYKNAANAEAIVMICVMRRGVEDEFFVEVPAGKYADGDRYQERGDG